MTHTKIDWEIVQTSGDLVRWLDRSGEVIAFDCETTGLAFNDQIILLSFSDGKTSIAVPTDLYFPGLSLIELRRILNEYLPNKKGIAHNAKFDMQVFQRNGIIYPKLKDDTCLMCHIFNPDNRKNLEIRIQEDFGIHKLPFKEICGKKWESIDWVKDVKSGKVTLEMLAEYACEDVFYTYKLQEYYEKRLEKDSLIDVYKKIEVPLVHVLKDMYMRGVRIDVPYLNKMGVEIDAAQEVAEQKIYEVAGTVFNLNSPKQKAEILYDVLGLPCVKSTKTGGRSTDVEVLEHLSAKGHDIATAMVEYSELQKLNSGYVKGIPQLVDGDGRLRASFQSDGTKTGRFCIEENQRVLTVGGLVPIKDIKVGTLVYCYDAFGQVAIRKVLNKWNKGVSKLVRVKWQSSGVSSQFGELLCTANHRILTKYRGWVEAQDLTREKVFHLVRKFNMENGKIRPRLYGTNSFMQVEQQVIKERYFNCDSSMHIHHINEDTSDNRIENLEVMTASEHTSFHGKLSAERGHIKYEHLRDHRPEPTYGKDNPTWIHRSKYQLLKMLVQAKGNLTKVSMDFETYKRKCSLEGINLIEVCKRFSSIGYLSRGKVLSTTELTTRESYKVLKVGYYRLKELYDYYGYTNHLVLSVKNAGVGVIYDIEVEDFNNFICEEICVHNSSNSPNLQNQPNNKRFPVRGCFIPTDGYVLGVADYSQIELRVMAHLSKDKRFCEAFHNGEDIHGKVATDIGIERRQAKCVHPKSLIFTEKGIVDISSLSSERGKDIFTHSTHRNVYVEGAMQEIKHFYSNGAGKTRLIVSKRNIIICSERHQILTTEGLIRAVDIKDSHIIVNESFPVVEKDTFVNVNPYFNGQKNIFSLHITEDWAYFFGMFTGDGCYLSSGKSVGIAAGVGGKYDTWRNTIREHLLSIGIPITQTKSNKNAMYIGSSGFAEFLEVCGYVKKGEGKTFRIPPHILNAKRAIKIAFLSGLIDTDGTISKDSTVNFTTKDVFLVQDASMLLDSLGYHYGIEPCWNKTYNKYYWRVHIYSSSIKEFSLEHQLKCVWKIDTLIERLIKINNRTEKSIGLTPMKSNKVSVNVPFEDSYLCDIEVDSEEHLYTVNGVITHNTVNFGILYGMGPAKLAATLGMSEAMAKETVRNYERTYEGYYKWKVQTERYAQKHGEVRTITNRVRRLPDARSDHKGKYFAALRQSVNTAVQGSAADIIKISMINLWKRSIAENLDLHILLQVHDELVCEFPKHNKDYCFQVMCEEMANAVKLIVPVEVDGKICENWSQMKDDDYIYNPLKSEIPIWLL